mgnify:CR=1 FL=1
MRRAKLANPGWPPRGASSRRSGGQHRVYCGSTPQQRARLQRALEQTPETAKRLTLAARKGEDLSDEDVLGMLEDLEELGIIPPESDEGDKP